MIILTNAIIVTGDSSQKGALAIDNQIIKDIWYDHDSVPASEIATATYPEAKIIDLEGLTLLPGAIDAHVHFREPGLTHKADITSESAAALLGGVTSFIDMPNTYPPTVSISAINDKLTLAEGRAFSNYGFHIGATNSNIDDIIALSENRQRNFAAVKVFMGSSTGNMLVDDSSTLQRLFQLKNVPIFIHSEDEATIRNNVEAVKAKYGEEIPFHEHINIRSRLCCIRSTAKALEMAIKYNTRLHILHVSTKEEVQMIRAAKVHNPQITAESSANYMWFCSDSYYSMKGMLKCNPSIKTSEDRQAIIQGFADGIIDTIGSDHAPHLLSEKNAPYLKCPSGLPSVGHSFEAMLTLAQAHDIPPTTLVSALAENPARIVDIKNRGQIKKGYYADLVVADLEAEHLAGKGGYKCGWSPYEGERMHGRIKMVFLNGEIAVKDGEIIGKPAALPLEY